MGDMCKGKQRFRDELAVKMALARMSRPGGKTEVAHRGYKCPKCGKYHVTSKPFNGDNDRSVYAR